MNTLEVMKLADVPEGSVIEVLDGPASNPFLSGRVYKLGAMCNHLSGHRYAWKRFTNERITLHPTLRVVVTNEYTDNEGRWLS